MSPSTTLLFKTLGCTHGCIKPPTKMFITVYCQCQHYSCNARLEGIAWKNVVVGLLVQFMQTKLAALSKINNCRVYRVLSARLMLVSCRRLQWTRVKRREGLQQYKLHVLLLTTHLACTADISMVKPKDCVSALQGKIAVALPSSHC